MGGASASGTSKDTVVVYTPALLDEGIYIANLTIPEGLFWSDIINPPGGHHMRHMLTKAHRKVCRARDAMLLCKLMRAGLQTGPKAQPQTAFGKDHESM